MSQETKKNLVPAINAVLKKHGLKGSVSVHNHSTLQLYIKSGELDFIQNFCDTIPAIHTSRVEDIVKNVKQDRYISVNTYHIANSYTGECLAALTELAAAMNNGNWDESDPSTDYFNVGWYIDIKIGRWDRPYVYNGPRTEKKEAA